MLSDLSWRSVKNYLVYGPVYLFWDVHSRRVQNPFRVKQVNRTIRFTRQMLKYGFCEVDCWSLYGILAEYIKPRLELFASMPLCGYPSTISPEEWEDKLKEMHRAFALIEKDANGDALCLEDYTEIEKGLASFAKWFTNLWD